jgi:hypothetical protein
LIDRICGLVTLLLMIAVPIRWVFCLCDDLAHPEVWDQDWTRDPRLYGPATVAAIVCLAVVFRYRVKLDRQAEEAEKRRRGREVCGPGDGNVQRGGHWHEQSD